MRVPAHAARATLAHAAPELHEAPEANQNRPSDAYELLAPHAPTIVEQEEEREKNDEQMRHLVVRAPAHHPLFLHHFSFH